MKPPQLFYADELCKFWPQTDVHNDFSNRKVRVLARPMPPRCNNGLLKRLAMSWLVFTGRADVLRWYRQ